MKGDEREKASKRTDADKPDKWHYWHGYHWRGFICYLPSNNVAWCWWWLNACYKNALHTQTADTCSTQTYVWLSFSYTVHERASESFFLLRCFQGKYLSVCKYLHIFRSCQQEKLMKAIMSQLRHAKGSCERVCHGNRCLILFHHRWRVTANTRSWENKPESTFRQAPQSTI